MPLVPHVSAGQIVASTWGNLVADHTVMRFTTAAQRSSQLTTPIVGQLTQLDTGPGIIQYWTGTTWADAGSGELGYGERTTPLTIGTGTEASSNTFAQTAAIAHDGRPVIVEFFIPSATLPAGVGSALSVWLFEDAASLGLAGTAMNVVSGQALVSMIGQRRLAAPSGTHTYSARAACSAGSGSVNGGTGATGTNGPAFIRVTRG